MEARSREQGNLGDEAQDRRLRVGILALLLSLALSVVIIRSGIPRVFRGALLVPYAIATNGVAAGIFKTSFFLAARGLRDRGGEPEVITNRRELAEARRLGKYVLASAAVAAVALTACVMAVR